MALFAFVAFRRVVSLAFLASVSMAGDTQQPRGAAVVAYLPEWRYEGANWETIAEHVTHLLLFSLEPGATGHIGAKDRIPRRDLMRLAQEASAKHGTELLICFGGNGRSAGFSPMVRDKRSRRRFLKELGKLMEELKLDGVDYNWEYPGYAFGKGYLSEEEIAADYKGLSLLIKETKHYYPNKTVTMAYYPDGRQEQLLVQYEIDKHIDLMHMMSYDQPGEQHSSWSFGEKTLLQGVGILPPEKLTLGVPFYGRHSKSGDWSTYEDLVQRHWPLSPLLDSVPAAAAAAAPEEQTATSGATIGFNGAETIERKARRALEAGAGGVMIWEVGQDCRLVPVTHGKDTHVRTCPSDDASLLLALTRGITAAGFERSRVEGWNADVAGRAADEL